jgi:serine/threonine-protein kinase
MFGLLVALNVRRQVWRQGVLDWRVPGYRAVRELRPLGTSGRSVLAVHEASGLPVTLRYHAPQPTSDGWRAHARALAGVVSPHVAPLYEYIEVTLPEQVGVATVREYVPGASVRRLVSASRLAPTSALAVLRTGLLALQTAHEHGVSHRGYKPENLLVDAHGTTRLADFSPPDRSDFRENSESAPQSWILEDVRAAVAVFLECLTGSRRAGAGKLPRRLRILTEPGTAGDGSALLEAVEKVGRTGWGQDWLSRGERELAGRVAKAGRSRSSDRT